MNVLGLIPARGGSKKIIEILENLTEYHIFGIGEVSNYEIDKIGILKATFKAMEMALFNLVKKCKNIEPYLVLVDGTVMPDFYEKLNCEISTRSSLGKSRLYLRGYPIATDKGLIMSGMAKFAKTDPSL